MAEIKNKIEEVKEVVKRYKWSQPKVDEAAQEMVDYALEIASDAKRREFYRQICQSSQR